MIPPQAGGPRAADWRQCETLLDRFDQAWRRGSAPRIEDFLGNAPSPAARRQLLEELIKLDLEYRWRSAQAPGGPAGPRVEQYQARFPELGPANQALLDLLAAEYRVRQRWGDRPGVADYARRFPTLGAALFEALKRVDANLAGEFAGRETPASSNSEVVLAPRAARLPDPPGQPAPATPLASTRELVQSLTAFPLLDGKQLTVVKQQSTGDPRAVAQQLVQRGWLTSYQAQQLVHGRGAELVLGPYVLLEPLGQGGTGLVFKARHQTMQRIVALKIIRRELTQDPEVLSRFYHETRVISQLDHPHIVHAYDAGQIGPIHYLAMQYVEGIDLGKLVKQQGPLPWAQACEYIRQAAWGLQHAHERGLVHRDIKPQNLMVASQGPGANAPGSPGTVKLLDLGLARLRRNVTTDDNSGQMTPVGSVIMGTPDYMAPEQAHDFHAADIRSDVYGLGCTLFYLLTGRPPFGEGSILVKLMRHEQAPPPDLGPICPNLPPNLSAILQRMMAKRPADRFQTPRELAAALEGLLGAVPQAILLAEPAGWQRPARKRLALAGLVGSLLILAAWLSISSRTPQPENRSQSSSAESAPPRDSPLDKLEASLIPAGRRWAGQPKELVAVLGEPRGGSQPAVVGMAFRPDGRLLALNGKAGNIELWELGGSAPTKKADLVGHGDTVHAVAFSPDGKTLGSGSRDKTVRLWDLAGLAPKEIAKLEGHRYPVQALAFASDGKTLASVGDEDTVYIWDVAGRPAKLRSSHRFNSGGLKATVFSPDRKLLVCGGTLDWTLRILDMSGAERERMVKGHQARVRALDFAPDGQLLASASDDQTVRLWKLGARVEEGLKLEGHGQAVTSVAFAADGKSLASVDQEGQVIWWNAVDGKPRQQWQLPGPLYKVVFAADGRHLAVGGKNGPVYILRLVPVPSAP